MALLCVQLMPGKESAWWLNTVTRCCWPVFLRAFLNRDVVPKLAPWFLNKFKPVVLVRFPLLIPSAPHVLSRARRAGMHSAPHPICAPSTA